MAFVPKDPPVDETIGSFTLDINGIMFSGPVLYEAEHGVYGAAIYIELRGSDELKKAAAQVLGADIENIVMAGYSADEDAIAGLSLKDYTGR